jgi:hypothetical protein
VWGGKVEKLRYGASTDEARQTRSKTSEAIERRSRKRHEESIDNNPSAALNRNSNDTYCRMRMEGTEARQTTRSKWLQIHHSRTEFRTNQGHYSDKTKQQPKVNRRIMRKRAHHRILIAIKDPTKKTLPREAIVKYLRVFNVSSRLFSGLPMHAAGMLFTLKKPGIDSFRP